MKVEVRSNSIVVDGYVNAVARDSYPIYSQRKKFIEQINQGTFADALKRNSKVRMLFNHDNNREIGMNGKNVQLVEDNIGLRVHATIDDAEVIEAAKNGELRGWSFGFRNPVSKWVEDEPYDRRYIESLDLIEVSLLTKQPAYRATTVEVRGEEEVELRDADATVEVSAIEEEQKQEDAKVPDYSALQKKINLIEKGIY